MTPISSVQTEEVQMSSETLEISWSVNLFFIIQMTEISSRPKTWLESLQM